MKRGGFRRNGDDRTGELFGDPPLPKKRIPVPHVRDHGTSEESARKLEPRVESLTNKAHRLVRKSGRLGVTCDELEVRHGFRHQTISGRLRCLVLEDRIIDSGRRRKSRAGRNVRVYIETERGRRDFL